MDNFSAFNTTPYPAYTLSELKAAVADGRGTDKMVSEIARREAVLAGDVSRMSAGERLNAARKVTK